WCSYATYRVLAERLAARGAAVLRLDYDGTHDSAGHYTDPDRVAAWLASIRCGLDEFAAGGFAKVALVGLRLGTTLAYLAADDRPAAGKLIEKLGAIAATRGLPGTGAILDVAVEHGFVPEQIVDAIAGWITLGEPVTAAFPPRAAEARMTWNGVPIVEQPLTT